MRSFEDSIEDIIENYDGSQKVSIAYLARVMDASIPQDSKVHFWELWCEPPVTSKGRWLSQFEAVNFVVSQLDEKRRLNWAAYGKTILAACDREYDGYTIDRVPYVAYILATTSHESLFAPIEEYASGQAYEGRTDLGNIKDGDGVRFKGRGFVQLTGRRNYKLYSYKLKGWGVEHWDLLGHPHYALEPENAARIMVDGMLYGRFTGKALKDYLYHGKDYVNARRIINGTDRAETIAGYAEAYERVLT